MKQGTTYQKLGDVCDVINGLWKGKKPPYINVGVIRNANFTKSFTLRYDNIEYLDVEVRQYEKRKLQKGDLIVEKSGGSEKQPVGRAVLFEREDGEFSFSNFTSILRIKDKDSFNSKFLFYFLLFIYKRGDTLGMQKATTGIHNIEFEKYLNISVPAISIAEQERIVERLDAAFAQIDELKSNAEKQLAEARALFQSALTQAMQPKPGWQEKKLKEIGLTQTGTTPSKSDKSNYGDFIPFIRPAEIDTDGYGNVNYESDVSLSEKGLSNGRLFKKHSILMVCIGTIGKVGFTSQDVSCNQQINVLTPSKEQYYKFIYYAMRNDVFQKEVIKVAKSAQATLPIINKSKWENLTMFVPKEIEEQQRISNYLDSLSSNIRELEEISRKTAAECDALKQALLRQIFE